MAEENDFAPTGEVVEEQKSTEFDLSKELDSRFGALQGRVAGVMGQRLKEITGEIDTRTEAAIRRVLEERENSSRAEAEYIRTLEQQGLDEDQIRAVVQANASRFKPAEPKREAPKQPTQQYIDGLSWSESERHQLGRRLTGLLDGLDLADVDVQDQRLWTGLTVSMSPDEAYVLAKANAAKLKEPRSTEQRTTSRQAQQTEATPPPTTRSANAGTTVVYDSKAEAAAAFASGEINIDQYKQALVQIQ